MDIVSLLILRAISGGGQTPVATDVSYDNTTSGLLADNVQSAIDELSSEKINTSEKGTANGVAELNENGIVLTSQLPSYVDDVLEYNTYSDFPQEGESGKIYVDLSTNKTYRWGGSSYVEISPSLALGETSSTAYRGDRGKVAYDHSQLTTGNPHNVTKAQVGLGNVDNTSDLNKPISTATQSALDNKLSEDDLYNMTEDSTVSGNPVTLKTLAKTSAKSCEVTFSPIQSGSGDPSPENVRPISGRDSLVLNQTGANQWDEEWEVGMIDNSGIPASASSRIRSKNFIPVLPNTTYYSKNMAWLFFYGNNTAHTSFIDKISIVNGTFTVPSTAHYMKFYTASGYGETYKHDISINYPSTDTAYHPYITPTTHTATFPDTVYGGSYDFVSGKVTSEYSTLKVSDISSWSGFGTLTDGTGNYVYKSNAFPTNQNDNVLYCDNRTRKSSSAWEGMTYGEYMATNYLIISVPLSVTSTSEAITYFAENDTEIAYISTPQEITLTPETIALLKGNNTMWTDGDNMEIIYTELDLTELPDVTSADEGKVLTVNSSGEWVAQDLPDGTNISY